MTSGETGVLVLEYQEINAHLRTNTTGFVNWFSLFLIFSLVAAITFLVTGEHRQGLRGLALQYGVPSACLMLHVIALAGILIFRHYVTAAHRKLDEIVKLLGDTGGSPVPVRFTLWMTHLMAAGFVVRTSHGSCCSCFPETDGHPVCGCDRRNAAMGAQQEGPRWRCPRGGCRSSRTLHGSARDQMLETRVRQAARRQVHRRDAETPRISLPVISAPLRVNVRDGRKAI